MSTLIVLDDPRLERQIKVASSRQSFHLPPLAIWYFGWVYRLVTWRRREVCLKLAAAHLKRSQPKLALPYLVEALERSSTSPQKAEVNCSLGEALSRLQLFDDAHLAFTMARVYHHEADELDLKGLGLLSLAWGDHCHREALCRSPLSANFQPLISEVREAFPAAIDYFMMIEDQPDELKARLSYVVKLDGLSDLPEVHAQLELIRPLLRQFGSPRQKLAYAKQAAWYHWRASLDPKPQPVPA